MKKFKSKKELYSYVWENRQHYSELSGKPLLQQSDMRWHFQMAHILAHGSYPKYKFNPNNIMLMLPEEHENQEQYEYFREKQFELKREYYAKFYGKEFD